MTRILLAAILTVATICAAYVAFLSDAEAQAMEPREATGAAIGSFIVQNKYTPAIETTHRFNVGDAEVVIHYLSTPNGLTGVDPRDVVTVTVSDGYIAIPSDVLLPEGESVEIVIYEALLG